MEKLLQLLDAIFPLSEELKEYLIITLKEKLLQRDDYLLREGQVCTNIYFIEAGLLRCFYRHGESEISAWFMKEGDIIFSVESFYAQEPTREYIQALEPCLLYYITHRELEFIYTQFADFNRNGRIVTEKYYRYVSNYTYQLRMKRAEERYENLLIYFPELAQRVPYKYLASWLGISAETFSRIRGGKKY